ncbi:MAG: metal-dependent transcriptional regulator [Anaerolineae bacterium]|nr:metal-dependent transcriptional regulator [Anaerolineae bacterium]
MRDHLSQSIEDYIKGVYELTRSQPRASTTQLAEFLEVTPASITGMIQKLAETEPPLLDYKKHRGVKLSADGKRVALEIVRHHRLIEMFLHQILGFPWDEVHEEADRLEHVISEKFEQRIAEALGHPLHDPHGDPIPRQDLSLPHTSPARLAELRPSHRARIMRVRDDDPELLRYLSEKDIVPGKKVLALEYSEFDSNLTVKVEGRNDQVVLGPNITALIHIEKLSESNSEN